MHRTLAIAFTGSLFASAFLLFLVQPIVAKLILPTLGSTPNVWNTCMVFFQATLLAGYGYAHASIRFLPNRAQRIVHIVVLCAGVLTLPIVLTNEAPPDEPLGWMLVALIVMIGLPFFALSATAPLFQAWFAQTDHPLRKNPYPLYAASNVGSLISLLSYPFVFDYFLDVDTQSVGWSYGYYVFIAVTVGIVGLTFRYTTPVEKPEGENDSTIRDRARWVLFAFVPSSLVIGSTTFISIDVGSVPLFWVVPLALYLLTFVFAFSTRTIPNERLAPWTVPLILVAAYTTFDVVALPLIATIVVHLGVVFVAGLVIHNRLVDAAPSAAGLTEFYLWMSFGGVLGGAFNAILAPSFFAGHYEYPIGLAAAILLVPLEQNDEKPSKVVFGLGIVGAMGLMASLAFGIAALFALSLFPVIAFVYRGQPKVRYLLAALVFFGGVFLNSALHPDVIARERSFFAASAVKLKEKDGLRIHELVHGSTVHGIQEQPQPEIEPRSYFHREGPLGRIFDAVNARRQPNVISVIGLGAGTMAAYSKPGDRVDFFEIDPAVIQIATDPSMFQFLSRSKGEVSIIVGDGRLQLQKRSKNEYDAMFIDAFSSDAIPTFLITKEAVEIYVSNVTPDGILVFQVSNRHLNLTPILARIGEELDLEARVYDFNTDGSDPLGPAASTWVVLSSDKALLDGLAGDWKVAKPGDAPLWTDSRHSIFSALR